jgi:hypothetical protein
LQQTSIKTSATKNSTQKIKQNVTSFIPKIIRKYQPVEGGATRGTTALVY